MTGRHSVFENMSLKVLDAATQLDKATRGVGTSLDKVSELMDVLSSPDLRSDLSVQNDLLRALNTLGIRPSTVDELNIRVRSEINGMKAATFGDRIAARSALAFCLSLHDVVLRRHDREFREVSTPYGFAA